jgi:hypothetical protein
MVASLAPREIVHRLDVVERNAWNLSRSARELRLHRKTLTEFLQRRGIALTSRQKPYTVLVRSTPYGLEKRCVVCREWLPLDECFTTHRAGAFGRDNRCNACRTEKRRGA